MKEVTKITEENVEEIEFTAEETKEQMLTFENDIIAGITAASNYKNTEDGKKKIEIVRNGKKFFEFSIRPLSEQEYDDCKKKYTKYVKNKRLGIKLPEDTNTTKYRAELIYQATVREDRKKIWDNKDIWNALTNNGCQIICPLDVIENCLLSGEKDKIIDAIDELSGYEGELEEVIKN